MPEPLSSLLATINRARPPMPAAAVVASAAGLATLRSTLTGDWTAAMQQIDDRLAELTQRRETLLRERRELLLDALDPGPSRVAVDKLDRALAVLDNDMSRLSDARAVASLKARQERDAAARREHAAAVAKFDAAIEALEQRAAEVDKLTLDYARALVDFANACDDARRRAPGLPTVHPSDALLSAERAHLAARRNLRARGVPWAWNPPEHPAPPTIAASIAEGAAWARAYIKPEG